MWKKFKKFVLQRPSNIIGIDIGTGAIKLVEISWQKGKPVLEKIGIIELPDKTIEGGTIVDRQQLAQTLSRLLATIATDSNKVSLAVCGRMMFARELNFPVMTMEELGETIKWDLEKYIPYTPGTYYFDFSIVGQGATKTEMKVLLVASPQDHVHNLIDMMKSVGLKLFSIDIEPVALYRIFHDADQVMVIDIGTLLSQVTIFHNNSPAVIRNIFIGGEKITNIIMETLDIKFNEAEYIKYHHQLLGKEEIPIKYVEVKKQLEFLVEEFARDIRHTVEYFQQQNNDVAITKFFITGGGAKLNHLAQSLEHLLGMPAIIHDPLAELEIPDFFDRTYLEDVAPRLSTAIGLALRGDAS